MAEATPSGGEGGVRPLTPEQARARAQKKAKATAHLQDVQATNSLRLAAAQRRMTEI
jgi:hypothetical protein